MAPLVEHNFEGFWGPQTSTLDWCEANYEVSFYIAEFWNTVSNFFLCVPQLIAAYLCASDGMERRFLVCFLALSVVGLGSFAFHGTLFYSMQLMDELPIIWSTSVLLYCLLENASPPDSKNPQLAMLLFLFCAVVTLIYVIWKHYLFFMGSHSVLIFSLIHYARKMMRQVAHRKEYYRKGMFFYGFGFFIWNIDQAFCPTLGEIRQWVGVYLAPLFQLHAWWHVFAAIGSFYAVNFCLDMRLNYLKRNNKTEKILGIMPIHRLVFNNN